MTHHGGQGNCKAPPSLGEAGPGHPQQATSDPQQRQQEVCNGQHEYRQDLQAGSVQ